jgi:hypothetical protein
VIQVLSRDQLEYRVAQVLETFVVCRPALRMLVVVGAMGQGLPQEGRLVKANAERTLQFL